MPLIPDWLMEAIDRMQGRITVEPLQMVTDPRDRYEAVNRRRAAERYKRSQSDTLGMADPEYVHPIERLLAAAAQGTDVQRAAAAAPPLDEAIREEEEEKQRLLEEANKPKMETKQSDWVQAEWGPGVQQRKFMEGTVPLIEDYDKRIAIGGDPKRGTAEEILMKIRAEAAAKGREGSLRGGIVTADDLRAAANPRGGGFSTAKDSPELRQRQADLDAWLEDAPIRSAEYAMSPEMSRRDPAGAERAAKVLADLKGQKEVNARTKLMESLIGSNGLIDNERAEKLRMLGFPISSSMVAKSKDDVISYFRDMQKAGGAKLASIDETAFLENPSLANEAKIERDAMILAKRYEDAVASGRMDPSTAERNFQNEVAAMMYKAGLALNIPEGIEPTIPGE